MVVSRVNRRRRYEHPLTVDGLPAFRRSIGLEAA
jgi:hypothetical protein